MANLLPSYFLYDKINSMDIEWKDISFFTVKFEYDGEKLIKYNLK